MNKENSPKLISIKIVGRNKIYFDEYVTAVTSVNEKGVFDILPTHANFISIIKDTLTIHKKSGERQEFKFPVGVLKVFHGKVTVYLDTISTKS